MNRLTNGNANAPPNTMDKSKDWQLELLMEKLRSKATQLKSFVETSKNVRMTLIDKRFALDSVDKSQHQKCLDTLQHSIKVTSLQSMVERLESLTRQLGLKFVLGPTGIELFISSDMFYLEIVLDQMGGVRDVKVHHEGKTEQQSCEELVNCLSKGDFDDFTAQLEGFASIYQLNAEKKVKCKAFTALQSLETDLTTLAQLQTFIKEPFNILYKSPVGILEKRKGGHAMKLTYFVSPYDLINKEKGDLDPINIDVITGKNLGYSVTMYMEGSTAHKLQTTSLITVNRNHNGKGTPSYAALTSTNSAVIPAYFVLKLNNPMPMCVSLVKQIQQITELECGDVSSPHPLLSLIATHSSDGKLDSGNKGLFVTLPDQNHCYFMTENKKMQGILVTNIPFTHPAHVAQILVILRQQALFNTIIGSCIRPNSKQDFESMVMLEISALSWTHISISLEHPLEESMATAEIDLSDISNLTCRVHSPGTPPPPNTPDIATDLTTKVLNKCFSIPITMRSILKYWDKQIVRKNHFGGHENFNLPLGSGDPGGRNGNSGNNLPDFEGKIKQEPTSSGHGINLPLMSHPHQGMFLNESIMSSANFTNFQSSSDSAAVLTNMELTNILSGNDKPKRGKRKASDELWKSSKRKLGDDDLDASSCDSTSRSTPLSQENEITTGSALGFHSDLELSGLDPSELINDKEVAEFDADDLGDVEDILSGGNSRDKTRKLDKSPLLGEFESKPQIIPPCVSITPISTSPGFGTSSLERRPTGLDIIPITTPPALPSSITITPITAQQSKNDERSKEKKSSKSRSDDKTKLEKKKKRKREESPMGPPERPAKDGLTKPVTVSIKATESPPLPSITPNSPNMVRKFSQSPTHNRNVSLSGKLSPSMMKSGIKTSSTHHSPKHSPGHVSSSPKHTLPGISSPKHHGTSPKHPSTSGSGKPSMSTLKNAANSPSSKSSSGEKKSTKESSREKDKKAGFVNSTKSKSSVKVKPLDLNAGMEIQSQDRLPSPSGMDLSKSGNANQLQRNRKGSLSAIVDKLKSAQHCDIPTDLTSKNKDRSTPLSSKTSESTKYMVKPSSEGIKLTINKTRTKDTSKSSSSSSSSSIKSSGTGSPKTHTGLKPGVNSGPASKKPQTLSQKTGSNLNSTTSAYNFNKSSTKTPGLKNSSIGSNLSKTSSKMSPKLGSSSATDLSRNKDRPKLNKSNSDKSIFSNRDNKKGSPTQTENENERNYKTMSKLEQFAATPLILDSGMTKFDKSFQIPKLSARAGADDKKLLANKVNTPDMNNINRSDGAKMFDMIGKNDISMTKYPLALPTSKIFDGNMEAKIRNSLNSVPNSLNISQSSASPKLQKDADKSDTQEDKSMLVTAGKDDISFKLNYPISASKNFPPPSNEPLSLSTKSIDLTSKFVTPAAPKDDVKKEKKLDDGLLDFSNKLDKGGNVSYPASPSVSVHIVKSPAPSPMINPSPHSASPGITDDELMDEALVGLGK